MNDLLILIPGNPSIPGIYDGFIDEILDRTPGMRAHVLSHRGQDSIAERIDNPRSVEHLIENHRERINEILEAEQPQRLFLAGHSLGCSIAIRLYPSLADRIDKLILLCPFLGPQPNNTLFLRIMSVNSINKLLIGLTRSYLSFKKPSQQTLRYRLRLGDSTDATHQSLTTGHFLANFLVLVSGYIRFFRSNPIAAEASRLPQQDTLYVFADNDFWAPRQLVEHLPSGARIVHLADIEHAFSLHAAQNQRVADCCASFLQEPGRPSKTRAVRAVAT